MCIYYVKIVLAVNIILCYYILYAFVFCMLHVTTLILTVCYL